MEPAAQAVQPVYPLPAHWPHLGLWQPPVPPPGVVEVRAEVVVVVDVVDTRLVTRVLDERAETVEVRGEAVDEDAGGLPVSGG